MSETPRIAILQDPYRKLDERCWAELRAYLLSSDVQDLKLSNPYLVNPPDGYSSQKIRLFVVGQQTDGWGANDLWREDKAIDSLMDVYLKWLLGRRKGTRIFWKFVKALEQQLEIAHNQIICSNLNKVDQNKKCPEPKVVSKMGEVFPVLREEIRLADPDVVVFLTGREPKFDRYLRTVFPEARINRDEKLQDLMDNVRFGDLRCKAFRTYHPNYLRRRRGGWKQVLDRLKECIRPSALDIPNASIDLSPI